MGIGLKSWKFLNFAGDRVSRHCRIRLSVFLLGLSSSFVGVLDIAFCAEDTAKPHEKHPSSTASHACVQILVRLAPLQDGNCALGRFCNSPIEDPDIMSSVEEYLADLQKNKKLMNSIVADLGFSGFTDDIQNEVRGILSRPGIDIEEVRKEIGAVWNRVSKTEVFELSDRDRLAHLLGYPQLTLAQLRQIRPILTDYLQDHQAIERILGNRDAAATNVKVSLHQTYIALTKFLGPSFSFPPSIDVVLYGYGLIGGVEDSHSVMDKPVINLNGNPSYSRSAGGWRVSFEHPSQNDPVFIHEAVHQIAELNLRARIEVYRRESDRLLGIEAVRDREIDLRLDKGTLEQSRAASKGSVTGLTLTEINQELLEIRQAKRRKDEEIEDFRSRTTSYQEFFSDLLALAFSKDSEAMYRGMDPAYVQKRSFLIDRSPDSWTETEEHLLLAPTGSFLWREYFSNPKYAGREAWLLENVFKAIEIEIQWQLQTHPKIDPVEMNKRLIEAIRSRIK